MSTSILSEVRNDKSRPYRRAYIKRRLLSTGLFESDWLEITNDIKRWGKITQKVDDVRQGKIKFSSNTIVVANDNGKYNDETNENSLWFGYASQQRTLLKIESGFLRQTLTSNLIYENSEVPNTYWDAAQYDVNYWDEQSTVFIGVIQGDINLNDKNEINLKADPLSQIFRDYPARNLIGFTAGGLTASQFIEILRDQRDADTTTANYIFRPFFGDTTSNWNIQTTTSVYTQLNSSANKEIINENVWDIIEKLAEAENYIAYVDNTGIFNFIDRDNISSTTTYEFHGIGSQNRSYGIQIKNIDFFGFRQSKYYSKVQLKHGEENTTTSYEIKEATLTVAGGNGPWNYGHRILSINNTWVNSTLASTIVNNIFNNVSSLKKELIFSSSFVPNLTLIDRFSITYDSNPISTDSLWDQRDWADTSGAALTGNELTWDSNVGNAIYIQNDEYKPLNIVVDLDNLETKIISREV